SITYQYNTTNIYKTNFFEDFFSNIRLMDVNAKGALLFKIAVFIIAINTALYIVCRAMGLPFPPFGDGSLLNGIAWSWMIFTWPISFILPLLIKHWATYIILFLTCHMIVSKISDLLNIGISNLANNIQDPQLIWWIKGIFALAMVLGYAWIVKTYLRNPPKTITKTA
ncbi:MAG: hypothetical protein FWE18_06610, partial [Alphaproteobacteria bacterium]|nr:hypothetical protein [Alphaproteobacteria bacterium]